MTLVWDWNGTLLEDVDAAVFALNRMLRVRGIGAITREHYRARFRFPSRDFYLELGVDLPNEDWGKICTDFHEGFESAGTQHLREGTMEALEAAAKAGCRQILLSAHREDLLRRDAESVGIAGYFESIIGTDNLDGASKLERARAHFAACPPSQPFVFIGDTLHDAEVASDLGAECILFTGGHQEASRLAVTGCPLVDSLSSAVSAALGRKRGEPLAKTGTASEKR